MASTDRRHGEPVPWGKRWWRARWSDLMVTAAALGGVVYIISLPLGEDGADEVQGIPGKTFAEVNGLAAPDDVVSYIRWDFALMLLVTIVLVGLMSIRSLNSFSTQIAALRRRRTWWPLRKMTSSVRWKLLGGAAAVVFLLADFLETWLLRHILTTDVVNGRLAPSNDDYSWFDNQIHALAWLHNLKWLSLAVAVLVTVSLLGRRTPTRPGQNRNAHGIPTDWYGPDHRPDEPSPRRPETTNADNSGEASEPTDAETVDSGSAEETTDAGRPPSEWAPTFGRLGVSVSGGGIRSASFALGVFEVLRNKDLLGRAKYVCSVSGGTYATSALEHANRTGEDAAVVLGRLRRRLNYLMTDTTKTLASLLRVIFGLLLNLVILYLVVFVVARPVGWLIGSPQIQEGLRYSGPVVVDVVSGDDDPDEPGTWESPKGCALTERPDAEPAVSLAAPPPDSATEVPAGDSNEVTRVEFDVTIPTQCVEVEPDDPASLGAEASDSPPRYWHFDVTQDPTGMSAVQAETSEVQAETSEDPIGVLKIENGVATIVRQPAVTAGKMSAAPRFPVWIQDALHQIRVNLPIPWIQLVTATVVEELPDPSLPGADLVVVDLADLELSGLADAAIVPTTDEELAALFEPLQPVSVEPVNPLDLRAGIDVDDRHTWIPGGLAVLAVVAYALTAVGWVVKRRRNVQRGPVGVIYWLPTPLTALAAASLALFIVLPWLAAELPKLIFASVTGGPPGALTASLPWLPAGLPPILAWLILSVAAVLQLKRQLSPAPKPDAAPKKRNTVALFGKIGAFITKVVVGLVLFSLFLATAVGVIATGAMNGPFGKGGWTSENAPILGWFRDTPDLVLWVGVGIGLLVTRTVFQANTWSLAPIYRNGLRWAFMDNDVEHGSLDGRPLDDPYDGCDKSVDHCNDPATARAEDEPFTTGTEDENEHEATQPGDPARKRAGYLEGSYAELVICCAANIVGPDRAPTGRNAVSFTASRSWIGGPELGWMPTTEYLCQLAPARAADLSIPSLTAISGAAASPAMGKKGLGPIGSILAILNVRLGGWLPHPQAVRDMTEHRSAWGPGTWKHTPGWTYFVREVLRQYKHESSYVYVSDGGHWENLGIVESLRRGCDHVVAISAAGDGVYSHGTLAEAIEIARTDLNIDIVIDSVWTMRPRAGGDPASTLPSGRQFVRQDGDNPELGRVAPVGYTFGTFTRNGVEAGNTPRTGKLLLIEATMVDGLPHDVHAYAEDHAEFPNISTGDQFFADRDFEAYRMLGLTLAEAAFDADEGVAFDLSCRTDGDT